MISRNLTVHQYKGTSMQQIERAVRWFAQSPGLNVPDYFNSQALFGRIIRGKKELNNNAINEWLYGYDMMREILTYIIRFPTIALSPHFRIRDWYRWTYGVPFAGVSYIAVCHVRPSAN